MKLEDLKGKELFKHLVENKSELIAKKKALPRKSDGIGGSPYFYEVDGSSIKKTDIGSIPKNATTIRAKIVANTSMWLDSQRDVLLPDCWARTIKDGQGRLHLKDHDYILDAEVGDVVSIYSMDLALSEFGLNKTGIAQSLIYESDVQKSYDEKIFNKYKSGRIQAHSIGLQYKDIRLAVNDEDFKEEFAEYNKWIDRIINKDEVNEEGFFWAVYQIKLIEVSAVIAPSNILTLTLSVKNDTPNWPLDESTEAKPSKFDISAAIKSATFFN